MSSRILVCLPSHAPRLNLRLLALCGVLGALVAGCSGAEDAPITELDLARADQALNCQGSSCDGLLPNDSSCKADVRDTGLGARLVDTQGRVIGGIGLFHSPRCQTVWASTTFYVANGPKNFRVCSVRKRATDNDASCADYVSSFGNDAPMKYVPAGKTAFGKVTVDGITTRTPDFTAP